MNQEIDRRDYWAWAAIVLATVAIRVPDLFLPMNRDSGIFAYGGWRILSGGVPYADFWDNKLPGVYYINALAIRLFGASPSGLVLFQMLWCAATALLFYQVARKFCGKRPALIASILFVLYSGSYGLSDDGNYTETYVALPVLLAVWAMLRWSRERKGLVLPVLVGAFAMAAGIIKQPAAAVIPALMCFAVARGGWRPAVGALSGAAIVVAGVLAWAIGNGVLHDAIDANVVFNRLYLTDAYTYGLSTALWNLLRGIVLMALPLVGAIGALLSRRLGSLPVEKVAWLLVPWFLLDVVGLAMGGRFANHYFLACLPSAMLLTVIFIDGLPQTQRAAAALVVACAVLILGPVWSIRSGGPGAAASPIASIAEREYYALHWILTERLPKGKQLPDEEIAQWIMARTKSSDTIYVWGWGTRVGFLSGRAFPSRYVHMHPMGATGFNRDARIRELARAIESKRPKFIVDQSALMPTTAPPLASGTAPRSTAPFFRLDGYEPIKRVVARDYARRGVVAGCVIYERL